jgi:hypothetical protein
MEVDEAEVRPNLDTTELSHEARTAPAASMEDASKDLSITGPPLPLTWASGSFKPIITQDGWKHASFVLTTAKYILVDKILQTMICGYVTIDMPAPRLSVVTLSMPPTFKYPNMDFGGMSTCHCSGGVVVIPSTCSALNGEITMKVMAASPTNKISFAISIMTDVI